MVRGTIYPNKNAGNYRVDIVFKSQVGAFTPRATELDLLSDTLTGGMAGTLFTELRTNRGIVYGVSSYSHTDVIDPQYSNFAIMTNVAADNILEAITATLQILEYAKSDQAYFSCTVPRTRNNVVTSLKTHAARSTPETYANQYVSEIPWGGCVVSYKQQIERLQRSLNVEALQSAAEIFRRDAMLVGKGPKDVTSSIVELINGPYCPLK